MQQWRLGLHSNSRRHQTIARSGLVSTEEDETELPFQQCIRLASVPVADGLFPKNEIWRDVARCLRDGGCGGSDVDETKLLQPFLLMRQKGQSGWYESPSSRLSASQ